MLVLGTQLIVADRALDPHVAIVELTTGKVRRRLGLHGSESGQLVSPGWIVAQDQSRFWVFDQRQSRLVLYDLRLLGESSYVRQLTIDSNAVARAPIPRRDSFIMTAMSPDHVLFIADSSGHVDPLDAVELPFTKRHFPDSVTRLLANMRSLAVDQDGGQFAISYRLANRLDFFRIDGRFVRTVRGPMNVAEPAFRRERGRVGLKSNTALAYGAAITASRRYVYAVWCGCTTEERSLGEKPRLILVYSWSGEFVTSFSLTGTVSAIAVSNDDRFLYSVRTHPWGAIEEWELPPSLR